MDRKAFLDAQAKFSKQQQGSYKKRKGKEVFIPKNKKRKDTLEEEEKEISAIIAGLSTPTKPEASTPTQNIAYKRRKSTRIKFSVKPKIPFVAPITIEETPSPEAKKPQKGEMQ